ncbi:MAG: cytochrome c peroxidase, partial [Myxococcota bacterium]
LLVTLEQQAAVPLFGEFPVELGVVGNEAAILDRFRTEVWQDRFRRAFPDEADPVRFDRIAAALASFERTLLSFDSPYDRYLEGDAAALSPAAQRGLELFFSDELECFHCHGGFLFSEAVNHEGLVLPEGGFFNTGLYNLDGAGAYPLDNPGLIEITGVPEDMGRFRAPSLRNVAVTAPYLDDGTAKTLEEVIDIYARGGRRIDAGPRAGDGSRSPLKSGFVSGFRLTPEERADLVAFLESLTDPTFLTDPRFSDPKGPSR